VLEYVTECIRTGWISSAGHFIEEFEDKGAAYCGMKLGIDRQVLYLLSGLAMTEVQLEQVCNIVREVLI
jgi:dTDP-4-amino-4,6-dideoxygalactose transaminase